jgi:poly(hydroxyalkanoate) granule-associated protein
MAKKSDGLTGRLTDGELATSILESANQIWLAGIGAFAVAQSEGGKTFDTFVKEGEKVQERAKKVAGQKLTEVKDMAIDTWG